MGRLGTESMVAVAGEGIALSWHLTANHYPPIRQGEDFARLAIQAVRDGRGDEPIDTGPDAPVPRRAPSAWAVIESWHLEPFLGEEES